jgi:hypothetical protein
MPRIASVITMLPSGLNRLTKVSIQLAVSQRNNDLAYNRPRAGRVRYSVSIACAVVTP